MSQRIKQKKRNEKIEQKFDDKMEIKIPSPVDEEGEKIIIINPN